MNLFIRLTSLLVLLLLSSCASRLANTREDAQQPFQRAKRVSGAPLEEQVLRCLKQNDGSKFRFEVTRIVKLDPIPYCGLGILSSIWSLGLWPNNMHAPYLAEVEGTVDGKTERRYYRLHLDDYYGVLLWLCPKGREDIQLARALTGAIQREDLADPQNPLHPKQR